MADTRDPFAQPEKVALYRDLSGGWTHVSRFYGAPGIDDANYHYDVVRISEPVEVQFTKLEDKEAIANAISMLDAKEKKILADSYVEVEKIRQQKQSLLALTHQTDVVS